MKLLILTQYYPPEIGAPQNRLHELAVRLKKEGVDVQVLTAMPNYPKMEIFEKYKKGKVKQEEIDGIPVFRSKIYVSQSKKIVSRLLNYFSFVWTSYWRGRKLGEFDFLMVESPPLFLGYSALRLSKKLNSKLIFNVSDLWPESAEKMGIVTNQRMLKMAYKLEEKCYKRSQLVTGQTQGIVENINERFPGVKTHWLPNGVDVSFYDPSKIKESNLRSVENITKDDIVFFYGGILGHAQGLHIVLEAAKKVEHIPQIKVILQGAGPEKQELLALKEKLSLTNVIFRDPVPKTEMPGILKEVDVALVPLRKLDLFQGAIPSKIFEALAMKKSLLLGVDGEAKKHFIEKGKAGLFFEPENIQDLADKMQKMAVNREELKQMGENARTYVSQHFNRNDIASKLQDVLKENA
ncbi:MAG: glycosyltransferase family 4 protein [Crocinitomicaceae bacterium]|nr:glycosyltransferase family 4 protein [Crocinitomicaceae bacterium]